MKKKRKFIEYQNYIVKLFPSEEKENPLSAKTITFQVTDDCNLRCTYCYQKNKGHHTMPFEVAKEFIDKLLDGNESINKYLKNPKSVIFEFIGGEPLLEIELIDKIVDYFRTRTLELNHPLQDMYMICICTNGLLYKDKKVQRFLQKNSKHLSFSVTVDGTKELHDSCRLLPDGSGSYDIAHSAALDWKSKGFYIGSKITMAPENIDYFDASLRQMIADNYNDINANYVYEDVWSIEDAKKAYEQSKKFTDWMRKEGIDSYDYAISFFNEEQGSPQRVEDNQNYCGGTGLMLAIDYKGDIYPCLRYMESSLGSEQKPYIIGTVKEGIAHTECTKDCVSCLNEVTRRSQCTDECFYCPVGSGCGWCSAYNYQCYGTVNKRSTAICDMHKARSLAINYYWNTYYEQHPEYNKVKDLWLPKEDALKIISEEEYEMLKEKTLKLGGRVNDKKIINEEDMEKILKEGE